MTRRTIGLSIALIAVGASVAAGLAAQDAQTPTFRGGTTVITLDVAVRQGNVAASGLTSADFVVTDNGVPQQIDASASSGVPLDVTLLLDTSGSVDALIDHLKHQVQNAARLLTTRDRLRLLTVAGAVSEAFPFQSPDATLPLDAINAGGGTALYDAIAMSLIRRRPPDRAELAVAFTDGDDTTSAISLPRLASLADRSEVVLDLFIVRSPAALAACAPQGHATSTPPLLAGGGCSPSPLGRIASATGGSLAIIGADDSVPHGLQQALAAFRSSYTLRYTARGVSPAGWHTLAVTIRKPGRFTVRARRGYVADEGKRQKAEVGSEVRGQAEAEGKGHGAEVKGVGR